MAFFLANESEFNKLTFSLIYPQSQSEVRLEFFKLFSKSNFTILKLRCISQTAAVSHKKIFLCQQLLKKVFLRPGIDVKQLWLLELCNSGFPSTPPQSFNNSPNVSPAIECFAFADSASAEYCPTFQFPCVCPSVCVSQA